MKNMSLRNAFLPVIVAIAILLTVSLLTGCGGSKQTNTGVQSKDKQTAEWAITFNGNTSQEAARKNLTQISEQVISYFQRSGKTVPAITIYVSPANATAGLIRFNWEDAAQGSLVTPPRPPAPPILPDPKTIGLILRNFNVMRIEANEFSNSRVFQ